LSKKVELNKFIKIFIFLFESMSLYNTSYPSVNPIKLCTWFEQKKECYKLDVDDHCYFLTSKY